MQSLISASRLLFALIIAAAASLASARDGAPDDGPRYPIVIGHRGASGYIPEHTLTAYYVAIQQGADYIEPDLVMSKDGVLIARHENEIGGTTDVGEKPEFAARRTTKVIDGASISGWFTEDFTLAELKTLRVKERIPALRPDNTRFDGQFQIPTLEEVLALVRFANEQRAAAARRAGEPKAPAIGVYPETKHPSYFDGIALSMEEPLVRTLHRWGYIGRRAPAIIQSFEVANLKDLRTMTRLPLAQLINASGKPYDFVVAGDPRTYADLATSSGLLDIAKYATGVGVHKDLVIPRNADGTLANPTTLVSDARSAGLLVHVWTLRAENNFLPADFRLGSDPSSIGDMVAEARAYLNAGVDGFFTDHPNFGVIARDSFVERRAAP